MKNFEGFFVKICDSNHSFAVIFGRNKCKEEKSSFIQVITRDSVYKKIFDYKDYKTTRKPFSVSIGKNKADTNGMVLNLPNIVASFRFDAFAPIKYDAMGFFRFFPFMECKHKVISMNHNASGKLTINEQEFSFEAGRSYIEGDQGCSFPKKYFWTQCNLFAENPSLSIMASCARIPYLGLRFVGTICIIQHEGHEYRLATYRMARIKLFTADKLTVKQGNKLLVIEVLDTNKHTHELLAPIGGKMDRTIKETVNTTVRYKLLSGSKTIFDVTSDHAAYEYSNTNLS